jgi:carboxypeptidase C (cathepsin A)
MKSSTLSMVMIAMLAAAGTAWTQGADTNGDPPATATSQLATKPAATRMAEPVPEAGKLSITQGQIKQGDTVLKYQATAGFMPLKDEAGKPRANIFFVAYTKEDVKPASARPLMFCFNGGPGAASVWLHLGTAGPKRLALRDDGRPLPPPLRLEDNDFTWLTEADLVFVDPVSTGFSRAVDPEKAKEFYGYKEDISAMGDFIRIYLTKYNRWDSPKFLAGESYGTTRAAGLADHLQENVGVSLNGVILVSTVLNFAVLSPGGGNDLPFPLYLPTYTAAAWQHKKLPTDLQNADLAKTLKEVEAFAAGDYTAGLAKGDRLTDVERADLVEKIARYSGLSKEYVSLSNLRLDPGRFEKELLRDQHKIIGRFDSRITGDPLDAINDSAEYDPALTPYRDGYTEGFNTYVRTVLNFDTDLSYEVLTGKVFPWNFGTGHGNGYLYVGDNLQSAMTRNPYLKVMVAQGTFDLATPYFATDYQMSHLGLSKELRKNLSQNYYPAGHMMYHDRKSLEQLHKDVADFVKAAMAK